jgi:heme oxygenase
MHHPSSAKSEVRAALREATGAIHVRLHQARPFAALARQQLDADGYTDLLRRIAAFHLTVAPSLTLDGSRGRRLAQDLAALGSAVPLRLDWSVPETPAAKLGWAYVVEGSSLGGKVIYGQLDYLLGNSVEGRSFFKGSALDRVRWQTLCERLEAAGRSAAAVKEMVDGANDAFELFEQALMGQVPAHA